MTSDTPDIRELATRVKSLERQNRRLRCLAVVGLGLVGGLVLFVGAKPSQAKLGGRQGVMADIASYVLLKDEKGTVRGTLGAGSPGPGLQFMDQAGRGRATYNEDGVMLRDEKGKVRVVLAITKEGAKLELLDENGKVLSLVSGANASVRHAAGAYWLSIPDSQCC